MPAHWHICAPVKFTVCPKMHPVCPRAEEQKWKIRHCSRANFNFRERQGFMVLVHLVVSETIRSWNQVSSAHVQCTTWLTKHKLFNTVAFAMKSVGRDCLMTKLEITVIQIGFGLIWISWACAHLLMWQIFVRVIIPTPTFWFWILSCMGVTVVTLKWIALKWCAFCLALHSAFCCHSCLGLFLEILQVSCFPMIDLQMWPVLFVFVFLVEYEKLSLGHWDGSNFSLVLVTYDGQFHLLIIEL